MKKILVVLLILAVAGGVFAQQGEWSLSGSVEVGTRINLDPQPDVDTTNDPVTVDGIAFNNWDAIRGALSIGYTKDSAFVGLSFTSNGETALTTTFDGDSFRAKFKSKDILYLLNGGKTTNMGVMSTQPDGGGVVERLWGEYKFIDGMVTLLAALKSDDSEYWVSDKTGTFGANGGKLGIYENWAGVINAWYKHTPFDDGDSFTHFDEWNGYNNNFLLSSVEVGGLNFGIVLPHLFMFAGPWSPDGTATGTEFVQDSLKQIILGVKFEQTPFEFAAQFSLINYGVYFGGKFFAGPITVGLSFTGILDGDTTAEGMNADPQLVKIGGRVDYEGAGFGGGLKGFYERQESDDGAGAKSPYYLTMIGVEPFFFYDAIPSHLRFMLDVGFYFPNLTDGSDSTKATVWALQPQIFWNFLGTGAGTYYGYDTGIMIRYRMANADLRDLTGLGPAGNVSVNFLDVVFKWGF